MQPPSPYPRSVFADRLSASSGIVELMDDLGEALASGQGKLLMMGGGTPAHLPEVQAVWRERMASLLGGDGREFDRMLADYDQPAGSPAFREEMAALLRRTYGWEIDARNVAITNGGQTAFFFLLNRFGGRMQGGGEKRILLPLMPEYIGYGDLGVSETPLFDARRPLVELHGEHRFKYRIDFDRLEVTEEHGAIAVSRPTNPSSNLLTDGEIERLRSLAAERGIPLIIDNAYGLPFPGVVFGEATPVWDEGIVLTMSLSKIGLPGTRTGIVVASEGIIDELRAMTAIVGLANNNVGQALARPLLASGEILRLASEVVRPFYAERAALAIELASECLPAGMPWRIHESEGAFFLWIWLDGLPVDCRTVYRRCREAGLIVVPGESFFYGLETEGWAHASRCVRISFTQPEEVVREGLRIFGRVVSEAYAAG